MNLALHAHKTYQPGNINKPFRTGMYTLAKGNNGRTTVSLPAFTARVLRKHELANRIPEYTLELTEINGPSKS